MRFSRAAFLLCVCGLAGCAYLGRRGTILYMAVNAEFSAKEMEMELDKSFLERFANRVTISANFTVDKAMGGAMIAALDGDLHFAGRSPQIALMTVSELANAALFPKAIAMVKRADSTKARLRLVGVWRLWPEHGGSAVQEQGKHVEPVDTYRPDHVFEIHPVTRVNGLSLLGSFTPVKGFSPGIAPETFSIFEKAGCKLTIKLTRISIVTTKGLYNDAEFIMEITGDQPLVVEDGRFVTASVLDMKGSLLVRNIRMVFVKGTPPERAVRSLSKGARLHVYGMPRISFAEVLRRVRASPSDSTELSKPLPYEMTILGVFNDEK